MFLTIATSVILLIVLSNVLFWPRVRKAAVAANSGSISILIPARNEESNIAQCVEAALRQGSELREVLVYDDHSTDGTGAIVAALAARDERVKLIAPQPLPPDWCGKNFACSQLALAAEGDWLLFLDADARLKDGGAAGILQVALDRKLTMLSCWPGFQLVNFSERALMPMLNFIVFTIYPAVLSLHRNEPSLGLAHGACMFMERATYRKLGGHDSVRGEIFEDTRLAQWWRRNGERSLCLDGQGVVSVRMYASFGEIWRGFQKNFYPAFRHGWMFWIFLLFQFTLFLLPFLMGNWTAAGVVLLSRALLVLRFAQPWWSVLLHPFAEAILLALGISSWWHCRSGRGVEWKGRVYLASRPASRV